MDIILSSLSNNSYKQYEGCYKRWFIYCKENKLNLYDASIPDIIRFLTITFNQGAQYGTLNSYRSALSLITRHKISDNDNLKRFFKGVFRSRPPLPKYNETWDPSVVLDFLAKWYPNDNLTLEQISKKLITLLALITAHRVQTLATIKICNIETHSSIIKIKIPDLIKTSRVGSTQPLLVLPFFNEKPEICPGRTLSAYLQRTLSIRDQSETLFVSFRSPHKPVGTQTLSRWIKTTLSLSGIDTSSFTAHSTRHAATSAALRLGVSIDLIRKTAGWSSSSQTFARFYNRPVNSDSVDDCFGVSIMRNNTTLS